MTFRLMVDVYVAVGRKALDHYNRFNRVFFHGFYCEHKRK